MTTDDKQSHWQQRYNDSACLFGDQPSPLLIRHAGLFKPGMSALALADGEGRNGLWLASQRLKTTTIEQSAPAVQRARTLADKHTLTTANILCADLFHWRWPQQQFDIIIDIFLHLPAEQRTKLAKLSYLALKPGGLLILEGYSQQQLTMDSGGPRDSALLYDAERLQQLYGQMDIELLQAEQTDVRVNGEFKGKGAVLQMIARKREQPA